MRFAPHIGVLLVAAAPAFAQTQSGSLGGTIGKQDKSVTGGEEARPPQRPLRAPAKNGCQKVVGNWTWRGGTSQTTFDASGTGRNTAFGAITWKCSGGTVVANWPTLGIVDRITIGEDGNSLLITNSHGETFSVTRSK
jgi:hypothetical protein